MSWWNWPLRLMMTLDGPSPSGGPSAMDDIAGSLAGVAASAGNPNAVAALNSERAYRQSLQNQQMRQQELQSELQSQDLQRQMMSKQLGGYLTPQQQADLNVSTAGRIADVQQQYQRPELIPTTGADGRITYYQSSWNPQTRSYDINPATVQQEQTISSPDAIQTPYAPDQVIKQLGPVPLTSANPELTKMQWQNQLELGRERALALDPDVQRSKINVASAEGAARANVEAQAARGSNAALANVPVPLIPAATADATKVAQEYADAVSAADDMKTFVDLARAGNKVAYAYSPTEGVLTLNTARGVKRVNMPEIESYAGSGSALDRVQAFLGKKATGASVPPDILDDMETLHGAISSNAQTKYANKLAIVNANYGSSFKPVPMDTTGAANRGIPGALPTPPAGATMKVPGSDGRLHWSDGKQDLGVVQ